MANGKQKLELNWVGKDKRPQLEPRILRADDTLSYHASDRRGASDRFDNFLIQGDNLLALKALEADFAGRVKCIYIDPPYNTGAAFEHYDDGLEHSLWLSVIRDRLEGLRNLLSDDGHIFLQLDDNEGHYGKVLCDEVFGRANFIATFVWRKVDSPNDNKVAVTPDHEFIFCYAKDAAFGGLQQRDAEELLQAYRGPDESGRFFRDRLLKKNGKNSLRSDRPTMWFPIAAPDGTPVLPIHDDGREACWAMGPKGVQELIRKNEIIWKNRGTEGAPIWTPYTREYAKENPTKPHFTIWNDLPTTRQTKAHQKVLFGAGREFSTPKPEELMARIIELATERGDLVLDSFAGSGTTGATAHKLGRRWIMVEQGDHAVTHIVPRLKKVVGGTDPGGATEACGWVGGGGFRFFRLAPSLLDKDQFDNWVISKKYDAAMLAEAMCKHMGFTYAPSTQHYWMHGYSSERDFIYVTTQSLPHDQLRALSDLVGPDRSLLVCCKAFQGKHVDEFKNLTVKKIPHSILHRCEWGKDDYSLEVAALAPVEPPAPVVEANGQEPEPEEPPRSRRKRKKKADTPETPMLDFDGEEA